MDKEYILYCDESEIKGRYYSNFYGGVMVGASQYERISTFLEDEKRRLNLHGEVKWSKVTETYLEKYKELICAFFSQIRAGHLRVRIMFRQNAHEPNNLTEEDYRNSYFKLYYQFIKHAYGLEYADLKYSPVKLRLYFDVFPENKEAASRFKGFLLALNKSPKIQTAGIRLLEEDIAEVQSCDHVLLQCLDIVLGAIHFRLNDKHKELIPGSRRRGKRTKAKEILYKSILKEIANIDDKLKNFNIGNSTAFLESAAKWSAPYMHWNFKPKDKTFREELTKAKKKPQPAYTTSDA